MRSIARILGGMAACAIPRGAWGLAGPSEVPIVGGVTTTSAIVGFRTSSAAEVRIKYADNKKFKNSEHSDPVRTAEDHDFTGKIELTGLRPAQKYWYLLMVDGQQHWWHQNEGGEVVQRFRTFPEPESGSSVRISVYSDAAKYFQGARGKSYESGKAGTTLALQIGDFDHSDPMDLAAHRLMHRGLRDIDSPGGYDAAANMFTQMAVAHVYDDHDYCGNDADGTCAFKRDALRAYDEYYPTYERPDAENGIYHKFTIGDAEIFMLDTRFNRTPDDEIDDAHKSMLGSAQKEWLRGALVDSRSAWKIIVSTVTTNKHARPGNIDHWGSFTTEADELKQFLEDQGLAASTVIVSGDLHSGGGLDGGCNSRFNVPELGVAHTNLKGGNTKAVGYWTEGVRDGSHKGYGSIVVAQDSLTLEARAANGNVVHSLTLPGSYNTDGCVNLGGGGGLGLQQCSDNFVTFNMPTSGDCADVEQFQEYTAPFENLDGGAQINNEATWYDCPISDLIVLTSNDIPEHKVFIANPNKPCVQNILAKFPRQPVLGSHKTETDNIQGFALNGVAAFSPLEAGNNNAVDPGADATLLDAQHWFGHPTAQHVWHYHSPFLGLDEDAGVPASDELLGVAMDGFPIYGPVPEPDLTLDECNFDPLHRRYHIRLKDQVNGTLPYCNGTDEALNWRYILGCYRGDLATSALQDSLTETVPEDCAEVDPRTLFDYTSSY